MTERDDLAKKIARLRELEKDAHPAPWELWTGCSWRRVGVRGTQDTVIEPIVAYDGHPDLVGYHNLELAIFLRNHALEIIDAQQREIGLLKARLHLRRSAPAIG